VGCGLVRRGIVLLGEGAKIGRGSGLDRDLRKEGSILIKEYLGMGTGCIGRRTNESTRVSAPPRSEGWQQLWRREGRGLRGG
jgi:hypothetical protein